MHKRIIIALLLIFAVVIGVIFLPVLFSKEPKYRGKTAEGWFRQYCRTAAFIRDLDRGRNEEALNALRVLSTNSVPMLVEKFYSTNANSWLETNLITLSDKLPVSWDFDPIVPTSEIPYAAGAGLRDLKPPAELLLPLVTNRLNSSNEDHRLQTICLLAELKLDAEEVLPRLEDMLTSTNLPRRRMAVECLQAYGPAARSAIPGVTKLVGSPESDRLLIQSACRLLASFSNSSVMAIPALKIRLANEPNPTTQLEYASTMGQIDPQQPEALQFFINLAANKTNGMRSLAIRALEMFGSNATIAAPVLAEAIGEEDSAIWHTAADTLLKMGQTNLVEAAAMEKLNKTNLSLRLSAAFFLLKHNPTNVAATSLVLDLLGKETTGGYVISRIGECYPPPQPVFDALFEIITNKTHRFHSEATQAMTQSREEAQAREEMKARYNLP